MSTQTQPTNESFRDSALAKNVNALSLNRWIERGAFPTSVLLIALTTFLCGWAFGFAPGPVVWLLLVASLGAVLYLVISMTNRASVIQKTDRKTRELLRYRALIEARVPQTAKSIDWQAIETYYDNTSLSLVQEMKTTQAYGEAFRALEKIMADDSGDNAIEP